MIDSIERKYQSVLDRLDSLKEDVFDKQMEYFPKDLWIAYLYRLMDQQENARDFYNSARIFLEARLKERPWDHRIYSSLGKAYAGLDRDAIFGPHFVSDIADIQTMVGEVDAAIDQIEYLLSIPCHISVSLLRIDPHWDPFRDLPGFQRLVAEEIHHSP